MQTPIEEYALSKVSVTRLRFDETNPNKPTKEQIAAIKKSFATHSICSGSVAYAIIIWTTILTISVSIVTVLTLGAQRSRQIV